MGRRPPRPRARGTTGATRLGGFISNWLTRKGVARVGSSCGQAFTPPGGRAAIMVSTRVGGRVRPLTLPLR